MTDKRSPKIAIVDYGLGNLFSVKHACDHVGLDAQITSHKKEVLDSDIVILPGVGAFGDAIQALERLDLVHPIKDFASSNKPIVGICLGLQLLMSESFEFGRHRGLGIVEGQAIRFNNPRNGSEILKVPQVGWNQIYRASKEGSLGRNGEAGHDRWLNTPLGGARNGEYMYFVHSFYVVPQDEKKILSWSRYGDTEFCSSLLTGNIFASQFHPERSGPQGLEIYRNLLSIVDYARIGASERQC